MSEIDTRRDHPTNRRQVQADVEAASGISNEDPASKTHLDEIAEDFRAALPAGKVRGVFDQARAPGDATLQLAHKILLSRAYTVLDAEKRSLKYLKPAPIKSKDIQRIRDAEGLTVEEAEEAINRRREVAKASAIAYLAEVRRGTSQLIKVSKGLIDATKVHSDINVANQVDEVRIVGAKGIIEAFAAPPGPTGDAPPRQPAADG